MAGRAGRAGMDTAGEAIVYADGPGGLKRVLDLVRQHANPVASCLREEKRGMKRAVLEVGAGPRRALGGAYIM